MTILGSLLDADHFPPWHDLELPFALIRLVQALMVHGFVQAIKQFWANNAIVGGPVGNGGLLARCRGKLIERVNPFGIEDLVYAGVVQTRRRLNSGKNLQGTIVTGFEGRSAGK